jgi:hypothetical protein
MLPFDTYILGRCEKLILPPIIMNNILKVVLHGHKKNNKTIHLTLGGLGVTALSDLLECKNTKDFQNLLRKNVPDTLFNYLISK